MRSMFLKRKYPEKLIDNEMKEVKFFPTNRQNKKREKGVSFVVTYYPILNSLNKIIRENVYLLNINEEIRKTFSPRPMVSFRSTRKLSSYLVRAKLYSLQKRPRFRKMWSTAILSLRWGTQTSWIKNITLCTKRDQGKASFLT